jgi:hypothetical protein
MIARLALAELRHRPGRALFLLGGYALGVAVMVVLLAVGEAMLEQARDAELIGGGDLVVLPAGISAEMLKAGGASTLFLGIDQARFLQRNVLESPRGREDLGILAASPLLDGRAVEITGPGGRIAAIATGEIPSRARAAGAYPTLIAGRWEDSEADRRWTRPTAGELLVEMDRMHLPAVRDSTWAEWHYFNVVLDDERWIYVTLMVSGEVGVPGRWGGRVLLTVRGRDGGHRSLERTIDGASVRFDTLAPDLRLDGRGFVALDDSVYLLRAEAGGVRVDLRVTPSAARYFPATELGGSELVSGYTAPALHARADGTVCLPRCEPVSGARAYHDHNWGVWRDVSWEWGSASDARSSLLYGVVRGAEGGSPRLFGYLVDGRGALAVFRPGEPEWIEARDVVVGGETVRVPRRFRLTDPVRGIRVTVDAPAAHVTRLERSSRRHFVQLRGVATVEVGGRELGRLDGFFETYVD